MCKILCVQTPDVIMMFLVWFPIPEKPFHIFFSTLIEKVMHMKPSLCHKCNYRQQLGIISIGFSQYILACCD